MKFCINCVHFYVEPVERFDPHTLKVYEATGNPQYGLCKRVERPRSVVTGRHDGGVYPFCSSERISPCGQSARFFQDKDIPVTPEEEEAFQEIDNTCPACKQDTMHLVGTGKYFKCGTCGNTQKPAQEEL